jgi:hypothetical protein
MNYENRVFYYLPCLYIKTVIFFKLINLFRQNHPMHAIIALFFFFFFNFWGRLFPHFSTAFYGYNNGYDQSRRMQHGQGQLSPGF